MFLATADEEAGGQMGVAWLLDHRPDVFAGIRYAVNEGGITETMQEHITYFGIETGTKMMVKLLSARAGPPVDAGVAHRSRAVHHSGRSGPSAPRGERASCTTSPRSGSSRGNFSMTSTTPSLPASSGFCRIGYRELTQNILFPAAIEPDHPSGVSMRVNLYDLPDENPDTRIEWLRSIASRYGVTIAQVFQKNGPTPISSRHTPMFALIAAEALKQYPGARAGTEILVTSTNDSMYLRTKGIDAYGIDAVSHRLEPNPGNPLHR